MKIAHKDDCRCRKNPEEWFVNAPEYFNCFWTYLEYNSYPHTLQQIATLLGMSISAVTNTEKKALKKLKKRLAKQI